jgi:hypothetical protein
MKKIHGLQIISTYETVKKDNEDIIRIIMKEKMDKKYIR